MNWVVFTLAMPALWFLHWGALCAIFLKGQGRPVVLAVPLSFLGPFGAMVAHAGTTATDNKLADTARLPPAPGNDADLPK